MDNIKELIVDYHRKLHGFISLGAVPEDSFFELEDEILQYFELVPPDTYYYQSALQLKMSKIVTVDAGSILKELSDYLLPLKQSIDGQVWFCHPKLIEVISISKGVYDMLIEYEELQCNEDDECLYVDKLASLHFEDKSQVRALLEAYGYYAEAILYELDIISETFAEQIDDCIDLKNSRRNYDPSCKCMISAIVHPFNGDMERLVTKYDVAEVWTEYGQLEEAMAELSQIVHGEEIQPVRLPELKAHVLAKEPAGLYDVEFCLVLCAFYDAMRSIPSDLLNGRYFVRLVHQYLLRHRFNFRAELIDRFIDAIFSFAKTKKTEGHETQKAK